MADEEPKKDEGFQPTGKEQHGAIINPTDPPKGEMQRAIEKASADRDKEPAKGQQEPAQKPTQAESAGEMRKRYEAEQARAKELEEKLAAYQSAFGDKAPDEIKPVWDKLSEKAGDGGVPEFLESVDGMREEYDSLRAKYQDKEKALKELSIQHSDEFQEKAQKPFQRAYDVFESLFYGEPDGKELAKKILETDDLHQVKDMLDSSEVLSSQYLQIIKAKDELLEKAENRQRMVTDWEKIQQENLKAAEIKAARDAEELQKSHALARKEDFRAARENFKVKDLHGFASQEDLDNIALDVYKHVEGVLTGDKTEGMDVSYQRTIKGQLWDTLGGKGVPALLEELNEARSELERIRGAAPRGSSSGASSTPGGGGGKTQFEQAMERVGVADSKWGNA